MDLLRDFYKFRKQHSGGGLQKKSEGGLKKWGESRNEGIGRGRGRREGREGVDNFLL